MLTNVDTLPPRSVLPYDLDNPPQRPPAKADPIMWAVSYLLFSEHQRALDGFCTAHTCRCAHRPWPCRSLNIAKGGLMTAARRLIFPLPES